MSQSVPLTGVTVFPLVEAALVQQCPGGRLPFSPADVGEVDRLVARRFTAGDGATAGRRRGQAAGARPVVRSGTGQSSRFSAHFVVQSSSSSSAAAAAAASNSSVGFCTDRHDDDMWLFCVQFHHMKMYTTTTREH